MDRATKIGMVNRAAVWGRHDNDGTWSGSFHPVTAGLDLVCFVCAWASSTAVDRSGNCDGRCRSAIRNGSCSSSARLAGASCSIDSSRVFRVRMVPRRFLGTWDRAAPHSGRACRSHEHRPSHADISRADSAAAQEA